MSSAFVSWTVLVCAVCCAVKVTGADSKEEMPTWTKKMSSHELIEPVRGQRSPSVSRFKSGPVPGSWYYIMGHGRDSKRSADRMNNVIDRLTAVLPEDDEDRSRRMPIYAQQRAHLSPNQKQLTLLRTIADDRAQRLLPVEAGAGAGLDDMAEFVSDRRIPGLEEISGQTLLNEFINFLALKERNLLNNCNTNVKQRD